MWTSQDDGNENWMVCEGERMSLTSLLGNSFSGSKKRSHFDNSFDIFIMS